MIATDYIGLLGNPEPNHGEQQDAAKAGHD